MRSRVRASGSTQDGSGSWRGSVATTRSIRSACSKMRGLEHVALHSFAGEHLIEWLIYEPDGSRRSLPRNSDLLDIAAEGTLSREGYQEMLLAIAPCAAEVPGTWLPAAGAAFVPAGGTATARDPRCVAAVKVRWISVDPSPYYSRDASIVRARRGASRGNGLPAECQRDQLSARDRQTLPR